MKSMAANVTGYLRQVIHNDFTFLLDIISIMLLDMKKTVFEANIILIMTNNHVKLL